MTSSSGTPFSDLLSAAVREKQRHERLRKQDIARAAHYSPSMFSHLLSGSRTPASREGVIGISRALELPPPRTDELLLAAGYAPLTQREHDVKFPALQKLQQQAVAEVSKHLHSPEREALSDLMTSDVALLIDALTSFTRVRRLIYERSWHQAAGDADLGIEKYYWSLRRVSARFRAHQLLAKAAAQQHTGPLMDALATAREAVEAGDVAQDSISRCLPRVRLGDIQSMRGHFTDASVHYEEAFTILKRWPSSTHNEQAWADHWQARIRTKQAILLLLQSYPVQAIERCEQALRSFRASGHRHEETRTFGVLGWAKAMLGEWDEAQALSELVLNALTELDPAHTDKKAWLQGYLALGGVHINKRNYADAKPILEAALACVGGSDKVGAEGNEIPFHDIGRLYLLLALLHARWEQGGERSKAKIHFAQALEFYTRGPWRDSARMAYVHINYGDFRMAQGDAKGSLIEYERAVQVSKESDPPNRYYYAAGLAQSCAAIIMVEETREVFEERARQAMEACRVGQYWRHWAQLESTWAQAAVKWMDYQGVLDHAGRALEHAGRYNQYVLRHVSWELWNLAPGLPGEVRHRLSSILPREGAPWINVRD